MLGGDFAACAVDDAGGDGDGASGGGSSARKVDVGEVVEVGGYGSGVAVGEKEADGAGEVGG